ncbi:ABC transporter permease [Nannocystis punicea]|uniref:ABC-2 family transporter protein n=1 Tax=Nannocystis punicea TaxID=2995304 RepID=A0ABY7HI86_9BACT|nr:ABC-2 family transporter protein [Nannocystis poenicansa]WAS98941.1 ABC-2 family transporter protein [Nannocystis poenicansa]
MTGGASERTGSKGHVPRVLFYARLVAAQLEMSTLTALQYRLGFWTEGLLGLLWSVIGIAPLFVAVDHLGAVKGWGRWELVVLTGCFTVLSGLFTALLQPALRESMTHILKGTLDYVLLRPADGLVLCLTCAFQPWHLVEVLGGLALVIAGLALGETEVTATGLLAGMVTGAAGLVALYAFGVLVLCASFRALQLQSLTHVMEALMDFGRWPAQVFPPLLRLLFTFVIPLLVMTSYPAEALLGRLSWGTVAQLAAVSAGLLALARFTWVRSVRGYTSASS